MYATRWLLCHCRPTMQWQRNDSNQKRDRNNPSPSLPLISPHQALDAKTPSRHSIYEFVVSGLGLHCRLLVFDWLRWWRRGKGERQVGKSTEEKVQWCVGTIPWSDNNLSHRSRERMAICVDFGSYIAIFYKNLDWHTSIQHSARCWRRGLCASRSMSGIVILVIMRPWC